MAYENFVIRVDRRSTRSHNPETDSLAGLTLKVGGASGTEIDNTVVVTTTNTKAFSNKTFDVDATGNVLSNVANGNIKAAAGIVETKLSLDYSTSGLNTAISNHTGSSSNPHSVTKAQVLASELIINTDVKSDAAIAESKLSLSYSTSSLNTAISNHTGSSSNPHSVTKAQVLAAEAIINTDVKSDAAIAESKLNLSFSTSSLDSRITALVSGSAFREYSKVITGDAAPADNTALSTLLPFGDDNAPQLEIGDFVVGDFLLFDFGGTPKLLKVYDDTGTLKVTSVGVTQPVQGYCYHVRYNLPAGVAANERRAIYAKSATVMIKIADEVWESANGIQLSTWTAGAGVISGSDTVLSALQKLSGNKATLALDNLASVALNASLTPGSDNAIALGAGDKRFTAAHAVEMNSNKYNSEGNADVLFQRNASDFMKFLSDRIVLSQPLKTADNGSGDSASITIGTGTASGTRGKVILAGLSIDASSTKIINVADGSALTDVASYGQIKALEDRAYVAAGWSGGSGTQAVLGNLGFVDTDGKVKPAGAGVTSIYKKRLVVCMDATIDNDASGNWKVLPSRAIGAASGGGTMVIGEEVYLSSTLGAITQNINGITAGHAIVFVGYATAAGNWEFLRPEYLGSA